MIDNKKSSIILVLKVLSEYSDEEHFLTHQDIIDKIYSIYGLEFERKSIAYSIDLLIELGYDIIKTRNGVSLYSRLFDLSEAKFLNDAIYSSQAITSKQASTLIKKINSTFSVYNRKDYDYLYKTDEITRTNNNSIFYNINIIEEGIKTKKRISFQYLTYDDNGKPICRNGGFRYIVSPYYLVNNSGRYYLICNYREKYAAISVYRVDYMININIEENWVYKDIKQVTNDDNFNIHKFLKDRIYLFNGKAVDALILINTPDSILFIKDWFGNNGTIFKKDDKLYFSVKCDENSLFYWLIQYGDNFTLIEPTDLLERLKDFYNKQAQRYNQ